MLAIVLAAAVGYGTVDGDASPLGPWLVGGYPQEMTLVVPNTLHTHDRLDAFDHDLVVRADDLPWSSNNSAGSILYLQLVEAAVHDPRAVAPSQAFLRHSQFAKNAGSPAFKTFGYTATTNEADDEYYYPLAATADGRKVLVVRAPGAVPSSCNTKACLYTHMNLLEDLTDYVATRTLTAVGAGPTTDHTFFFVSGAGHLKSSSTDAALWLLGGALLVAIFAVAADTMIHHQLLDVPEKAQVPMDTELVAFAVVGFFSAVVTTLLCVYWDEAAGKPHSTIRVVDGDNGVHRHLPTWTFVFVGLSSSAVVVSVAALIFSHSRHGSAPRKTNPRYSKWSRFLIVFVTTVAVVLACVLPTAYESALGSRAMGLTNKTLVDGALDAASRILRSAYETEADARKALDEDSYMSSAKLASWGSVSVMLAAAAAAAGFNQVRAEHAPHGSRVAIVVVVAALVAAAAAVTQASIAEHFDLTDHGVCTMPPDWGWYMAALLGAAVFYTAAAVLLALIIAKVYTPDRLVSTVPFMLVVAGGVGHTLAAYSHLDSHCPRLTDNHWVGTFSAMSLALLITTLVLYAFSAPTQTGTATNMQSDDMEMEKMASPASPPRYTTAPPEKKTTMNGFFGL